MKRSTLVILNIVLCMLISMSAHAYTVIWKVNGFDYTTTSSKKKAQAPAAPQSNGFTKEFVGWTTVADYDHATDAPTTLFTGSVNIKTDTTFYAVFASNDGADNYSDYTTSHCANVTLLSDTTIKLSDAQAGTTVLVAPEDIDDKLWFNVNSGAEIIANAGTINFKADNEGTYTIKLERPADWKVCSPINKTIQIEVIKDCQEIYIQGDTTISLTDAQAATMLLSNCPSTIWEEVQKYAKVAWLNHVDIVEKVDGYYFQADAAGVYSASFRRAEDGVYCELNKTITITVIDSCTVTYDSYDDDWCPEAGSQGGKYKYGDTFVVSNSIPADYTGFGRQFVNWNTSDYLRKDGTPYLPGESFKVTEDIVLYSQWQWDVTSDYEDVDGDLEYFYDTDVTIKAGASLSVYSDTEFSTLTLEGGLCNGGTEYAMPGLFIDEYASFWKNNADNTVDFLLSINKDNYYPFAVPFPVAVADIDYADPTLAAASVYGKHFVIKTYDGQARATNGGDKDNNWVVVSESATLQPGQGYIITAVPVSGKAIIHIPLQFTDDWTEAGEIEQHAGLNRSRVATTAYSGAAADSDPIHAGWNFVANPYLSAIDGSSITGATYFTIPAYDFSAYTQVLAADAIIPAEYPFFVQVASHTNMHFASSGRAAVPAPLRAPYAGEDDQLYIKLTIEQDEQAADHTGIVIAEDYTTAYEVGADLEKMLGHKYTANIYSLNGNAQLAYNALSLQDALSYIPLGIRIAQSGEYTIRIEDMQVSEEIAAIKLYDAQTNMETDLMLFDYTFVADAAQDNNRFAIRLVEKANTATGLENITHYTTNQKIIYNNQLYILQDGQLYNAVGAKMN